MTRKHTPCQLDKDDVNDYGYTEYDAYHKGTARHHRIHIGADDGDKGTMRLLLGTRAWPVFVQ